MSIFKPCKKCACYREDILVSGENQKVCSPPVLSIFAVLCKDVNAVKCRKIRRFMDNGRKNQNNI